MTKLFIRRKRKVRKIIVPIGPSIAYCPLTRGLFSLIDSEDVERVGEWNWNAHWNECTGSYYARRIEISPDSRKTVLLARFVLRCEDEQIPDHIHHCTLEDRKSELRAITVTQNNWNRRQGRNNTSGATGVHKKRGRWVGRVSENGKRKFIGAFVLKTDAEAAVKAELARIRGGFARAA